ncbi:hypothetical protein FOA52_003545 [Chlamydomonas sp. UWO 241]|nr:hypothetical protein FOA52_003545 [Chlamydomonas sp. UWO 241]
MDVQVELFAKGDAEFMGLFSAPSVLDGMAKKLDASQKRVDALLKLKNEFQELARVLAKPKLSVFTGQALANTSWALATLGHKDKAVMGALRVALAIARKPTSSHGPQSNEIQSISSLWVSINCFVFFIKLAGLYRGCDLQAVVQIVYTSIYLIHWLVALFPRRRSSNNTSSSNKLAAALRWLFVDHVFAFLHIARNMRVLTLTAFNGNVSWSSPHNAMILPACYGALAAIMEPYDLTTTLVVNWAVLLPRSMIQLALLARREELSLVHVSGAGGGVSEQEMRALVEEVLLEEMLQEVHPAPEGMRAPGCILDSTSDMCQLGSDDGSAPKQLHVGTGQAHTPVAPPAMESVQLLVATTPLLALPSHDGGRSRVSMQFATPLLARALGHDPELVISFAPAGGASAPLASLLRARVCDLQMVAHTRGNPPGLMDIDIHLGGVLAGTAREYGGMLIAQLVDGPTMLAAVPVPLLPCVARPAVAELSRLGLDLRTTSHIARDLGLLLLALRPAGELRHARVSAQHLTQWAQQAQLPGTLALLDAAVAQMDAVDAPPPLRMPAPRPGAPPAAGGAVRAEGGGSASVAKPSGINAGFLGGATSCFMYTLPFIVILIMRARPALLARLPRWLSHADSSLMRRLANLAFAVACTQAFGTIPPGVITLLQTGMDIPFWGMFDFGEPLHVRVCLTTTPVSPAARQAHRVLPSIAPVDVGCNLAATPLPAHPGPKGKRKGAKGRAKVTKDGDELIGARVFMPGSEFYEAGLRPRHVVGSILGHDDVHKGCMVVRIAGERQRYFFPMGSLRVWAAAAAAAGSDDEQPGFEYAYEDGVVVEQPPLPMREGSGGALGEEPVLPLGVGEEAHEVEGLAKRDATLAEERAAEAAAVEEDEEGHQAADVAGSSSRPSSSGRRAAAAAAVVAARRQARPPFGGGGSGSSGSDIPLVSGLCGEDGVGSGAPLAAAAAAAVDALQESPPLGGGSPGSPGSCGIPLVSVLRGADGAGGGAPPAAVVAAAVAAAVAAVAARRQASPALGVGIPLANAPHTRAPGAPSHGAAGGGTWRAASPAAPHVHSGRPSLVQLWQRQKQQEQQQQQGSKSEEEGAGAGQSFAAGIKRPSPSTEDDGEEQACKPPTLTHCKRARTLSETAAAAVAVAAAAPQHTSTPTTATVAPRVTPPPQQSGARSGSPGSGVGSVGGGVGGRGGVRKVAAGGRPKKRRGRSQREQLSDIVGKGVDIPGGVFGQDIPGFFYRARVVGPDKTHPGCVTVSLLDGSRARYYFPVPEVREWVSGMHTRLGLDWQEEHDTVGEDSVAFAARVLVDMAAGALGGGGRKIGSSGDALMQATMKDDGEGEEGEEAAEAADAAADADAAAGDASLLMMAAAAEDGGGDSDGAAGTVAALALAAEPTIAAADAEVARVAKSGAAAVARAPLAAAEPTGALQCEGLLRSGGLDNRGGGGDVVIGERSASVSHVSCAGEERGIEGAQAAGGGDVPCIIGHTDCDRGDSGFSDDHEDGMDCNGCEGAGGCEGEDGCVRGGGTGFGAGSNSSQVVVGTPLRVSASPATSGNGDGGAHHHVSCANSPDAGTPTGVMRLF